MNWHLEKLPNLWDSPPLPYHDPIAAPSSVKEADLLIQQIEM